MKYEFYCQSCQKLTIEYQSIKETTPSITCECGAEAPKNFSCQIGSTASPEYFNNYFFDLTPGQGCRNTWHVSSDKLQSKNKTGTVKKLS